MFSEKLTSKLLQDGVGILLQMWFLDSLAVAQCAAFLYQILCGSIMLNSKIQIVEM